MQRFAFVLLFVVCSQLHAVEEPAGYRMEQYDDKVPETLAGATRVAAPQVLELQQNEEAVVVDVIPEQRAPESLPEGQLWLPVPHKGIAGSVWLPDVGYGQLSVVTESYFKDQLRTLSDGDWNHPLVFYCRMDCWMSWNAAKRALSYGYTSVFWYAEGIEDWTFAGNEVEILQPAEGVRQGAR